MHVPDLQRMAGHVAVPCAADCKCDHVHRGQPCKLVGQPQGCLHRWGQGGPCDGLHKDCQKPPYTGLEYVVPPGYAAQEDAAVETHTLQELGLQIQVQGASR